MGLPSAADSPRLRGATDELRAQGYRYHRLIVSKAHRSSFTPSVLLKNPARSVGHDPAFPTSGSLFTLESEKPTTTGLPLLKQLLCESVFGVHASSFG